jgi:hypothetical protein
VLSSVAYHPRTTPGSFNTKSFDLQLSWVNPGRSLHMRIIAPQDRRPKGESTIMWYHE